MTITEKPIRLDSRGCGRSRVAPPLVQMENPGVSEMIQLDVDETQPEAQTVISIIPVNPPGPTRVQKVPHGSSSSTFVNLQQGLKDSHQSGGSPPTPGKHKKKPPGQKPQPAEPTSREAKPVPRPRERTAPSKPPPPPQPASGKKPPKQPVAADESEESSPDFSDGDDDPVPVARSV